MTSADFFQFESEIYSSAGRLDPWAWCWREGAIPEGSIEVSPLGAIAVLAKSGKMRRLPVGVIGPREASRQQQETAAALGREIGRSNLTLLCGGMGGVMESAAAACHSAGGLTVGFLPGESWRDANPFITLPLATGLSEGRNIVIARSSLALIAIGTSYGTLTEVAYGLHFGKPVIGLTGAPEVDGVVHVSTVADAMSCLATRLLGAASVS